MASAATQIAAVGDDRIYFKNIIIFYYCKRQQFIENKFINNKIYYRGPPVMASAATRIAAVSDDRFIINIL